MTKYYTDNSAKFKNCQIMNQDATDFKWKKPNASLSPRPVSTW